MYDIKVVGVGSGGCAALNHMIAAGLNGVEFIAMDIDTQVLELTSAATKLHIGWQMMRRLRGPCCGNDPDIGRAAAEESIYDIRAALRGADLVIIVAAMGGGAGSGAAPVIAAEARKLEAFPIAVTCSPFVFEGTRRRGNAREGLELMVKQVHAVFNLSAEKVMKIIDPTLTLDQAYHSLDHLLYQTVKGITTLVAEEHRVVNLKMSEIKYALRESGYGMVGIGEGSGPDGAVQAVTASITSPLLDAPIEHSSKVLLSIMGGDHLTLNDVAAATERISDVLEPDTFIEFNATFIDPKPDRVVAAVLCCGMPTGPIPRI